MPNMGYLVASYIALTLLTLFLMSSSRDFVRVEPLEVVFCAIFWPFVWILWPIAKLVEAIRHRFLY